MRPASAGASEAGRPEARRLAVGALGVAGVAPRARAELRCLCAVHRAPDAEGAAAPASPAVPVPWGQQAEIAGVLPDDVLEFALWGEGDGGVEEIVARTRLACSSCWSAAFEGELPLALAGEPGPAGASAAHLRVRAAEAAGSVRESEWSGLVAMLQETAVFRDCDPALLHTLVARSQRTHVARGRPLPLPAGGRLLLVERGALVVKVGDGPRVAVGPGQLLNCAGLLETEQPSGNPYGAASYEVFNYAGAPPDIFKDGLANPHQLTDEQLCFYSLCPYATIAARPPGECLPISAAGVTYADAPLASVGGVAREHGAVVLEVPAPWEDGAAEPQAPRPRSRAEARRQVGGQAGLLRAQRRLMSSFGEVVLPGAPPEVIWAIAEVSEVRFVDAGRKVVSEGDVGEKGDAIIVIDEGTASVDTRAVGGSSVPSRLSVGRLHAGAVIGHAGLVSAAVPRAATVRAETNLVVVIVPAQALEGVLVRFPGALEGCRDHLLECAALLQERLPTKAEVMQTLNLFQGFDARFLHDVASAGERRAMLCGQTVVEQGSGSGALFVLEYGRCDVDIRGEGKINEVMAGSCFGERTLLGLTRTASSTVRVATALAVVLAIPWSALQACLEHTEEQELLAAMKKAPQAGRLGRNLGGRLRGVELFRACGDAFLATLGGASEAWGYMPGQMITCEGHNEKDPSMFVLLGGMVVAERDGRQLARMSPGASFGELAMLGVSAERAVTVRAMTFCFVVGVPRSAFFGALERHPDQEEHFNEVLSGSEYTTGVMWPCLRDVPVRLLYLLDLYAERKSLAEGDGSLGEALLDEAAVLLVDGEVGLFDERGEQASATLTAGQCYNEQILAGAPAQLAFTLVPLTHCQVRILSRQTWDKVMAEFDDERGRVEAAVLRYKAEQGERSLGHAPGGAGALRASVAFFHAASEDFMASVRALMQTRLFLPGERVTSRGGLGGLAPRGEHGPKPGREELDEDGEPTLYLLLDGEAYRDDKAGSSLVSPGEAFGEAALLGVARASPGPWRAGSTACTVQVLAQSALQEVLRRHPREQGLLAKLCGEVAEIGSESIAQQLRRCRLMRELDGKFAEEIAVGAEIVLFAPGSTVIQHGDHCELGSTPLHLLLAGRVWMESQLGIVYTVVQAGDTFGEAGAFGMTEEYSSTAHVYQDGIACCARFAGDSVREALDRHPSTWEPLAQYVEGQEKTHADIESSRFKWLQEVAVPALASIPFLSRCPKDFLNSVASTLTESPYARGDTISKLGETTRAMIVVLSGSVDLVAKSGVSVGRLHAGASFGEAAALGLFPAFTCAVVAAERCRVLTVPEAAIRRALAAPGAKRVAAQFHGLVRCRQQQVADGVPMSRLGLGIPADDVAARAVALTADMVELFPGEAVELLPDDGPCGACFGVLLGGSAALHIGGEDRPVVALPPGSLVLEGLAARYGAHLVARTACALYRVRWSDLTVAVTSASGGQDWIWRFRLEERSLHGRLRARLESARARLDGSSRTLTAGGGSRQDAPCPRPREPRQARQARPRRGRTPRGSRHLPLMEPELGEAADLWGDAETTLLPREHTGQSVDELSFGQSGMSFWTRSSELSRPRTVFSSLGGKSSKPSASLSTSQLMRTLHAHRLQGPWCGKSAFARPGVVGSASAPSLQLPQLVRDQGRPWSTAGGDQRSSGGQHGALSGLASTPPPVVLSSGRRSGSASGQGGRPLSRDRGAGAP